MENNASLFVHLSAGDLLRAERNRQNSPVAELIHHYIKEGLIVPMQITIHLLKEAMKAKVKELASLANSASDRALIFLIDGFPREIDQGMSFEEKVCVCVCGGIGGLGWLNNYWDCN